ncbi:hypothetical protein AB0I60_10130 [Actinosynnema sp. NPDC050436]|uniref:hypothetical protein n=1 Tax=Actinosynnema sp. NPDC050436 TaxID=3155659 RepID=UPI0033FFE311
MPLVVFGLIALVVLLVAGATPQVGRRFLARWGVPDADEAQSRQAARYLRDRRLLCLPLVLFTPGVFALPPHHAELLVLSQLRHFLPVLVALLLAEAFSAVRRVQGPRAAALSRRGWRDLVPPWAVIVLLALAAAALLISLLGLFFPPATRKPPAFPHGGTVTLAVVLGLAAVFGVVLLAVRRGVVADPLVDAALRARSARVAVGVGMAFTGYLVFAAHRWVLMLDDVWVPVHSIALLLGLAAIPVSFGTWFRVARPTRTDPFVRAARPTS